MSEDKDLFICRPLTREDMEKARKSIMEAPPIDSSKYIFHCLGCNETGPWDDRGQHKCSRMPGVSLDEVNQFELREKIPKYLEKLAEEFFSKEGEGE